MKRCHTLTHRHLFIVGFLYYFIFPQILGYVGVFEASNSFGFVSAYFEPDNDWWPYLITFTLAAPAMYLLGSALTQLTAARRRAGTSTRERSSSWVLLLIYGLILVALTYNARSLLFTGYIETVDSSVLGPLATLHMLVLFQYLYERASHRSTSVAFGLLLAVTSCILLSMGGRLYVLSALVSIYFRWWNWGARSAAEQLRSLVLILCVPVALVAVGMWRVGETDYSLVSFYFAAESVFTGISGFTLFTSGNWSPVDSPYEFLASFANVVPSAIWPNKADWFISLTVPMQNYEAPFGAVSIIASTVGNFGFIGGMLFFFFVGFYMSAVARTRGNPLREAHYCALVGLLPFMFFRDPFQIQVKVVVTYFILYWVAKLMSITIRDRLSSKGAAGIDGDFRPQSGKVI